MSSYINILTSLDFFKALSDENRLKIVELLSIHSFSVNKLVKTLNLSQPLVSKHLRYLREVGIVDVDPQGQKRVYRLVNQEMSTLLSTISQVWESRFNRMEEELEKELKKEQENKPQKENKHVKK